MNLVKEYVSAFHWWTQEVLRVGVCSLITTVNKKFRWLMDLHEAPLWVQNYKIRFCHFYLLISIKVSTLNNKPPEI